MTALVAWLRSWGLFHWLAGWSWAERILVGGLSLLPFIVLFVGGRAGSGGAGVCALLAFVALQIVVWRHGGWHLLGPHFFYDVVRLARRGRSTVLRVAYITAMLIGLAFVYESSSLVRSNDFARVSERFAFALFLTQNLAIMVLTPAYLGSAITEEKERRTLELLFTTHLNNAEIVLGKLFSRTIHLVGFVLAGFPILSLVQFWGGIDMLLIVGNLANTLLNILSIGSICLLCSAMAKTVSGAVMFSYALLVPIGFCCGVPGRGMLFVLQDARTGATGTVTVQDIGALAIGHFTVAAACLWLAIVALREREPFSPVARDAARGKDTSVPEAVGMPTLATAVQTERVHRLTPPEPMIARSVEPVDEFSIPYTLPPVSDDALLWKERFLGGPPLIGSPIMLVPAIPFIATGIMVVIVLLGNAFMASGEAYRQTVEQYSVGFRFFYYVFLACYLMGVCYRAAASVARERQQQTLDPLLLMPIERREILWAKWIGIVWRGRPWLWLLLGDVLIGMLIGGFHPLSAVLLLVGPLPIIFFFANLGMLISVTASTVLRANLIMVCVVVLFVGIMLAGMASHSPYAYLESCAFSFWHPLEFDQRRVLMTVGLIAAYLLAGGICWTLALRQFEDRARDTSA